MACFWEVGENDTHSLPSTTDYFDIFSCTEKRMKTLFTLKSFIMKV